MTLEEAEQRFVYDAATGRLRLRRDEGRGKRAGDFASTHYSYKKYRTVYVLGGGNVEEHRVIWLLLCKEWSCGSTPIDHINGDRLDNRIENLRRATPAANSANTGITRNNTSGVKGVAWDPRRRMWRARYKHNYRNVHLGYFDSIEGAKAAYDAKRLQIHGEFVRL